MQIEFQDEVCLLLLVLHLHLSRGVLPMQAPLYSGEIGLFHSPNNQRVMIDTRADGFFT